MALKLAPWTFLVLGVSVGVIGIAYGVTNMIPNLQEKGNWEKNRDELQTEADKLPAAKRRRDDALRLAQEADREWNRIVAERTPPKAVDEGGIDLGVEGYQLTIDIKRYQNSLQAALNAQMRRGGVQVVNGPVVRRTGDDVLPPTILADFFNYPAPFAFPVVLETFPSMTVQGTYEQIMDHVRAFKTMPRYLATAHNLRLQGTSPNLTATYDLVLVGMIRAKEIAAPLPDGGGAAAAAPGGAPGGFPGGGPPRGFGGGPPSGFGGPPSGFGGPPTGAGGFRGGAPGAAGGPEGAGVGR